MTEFNEEQLDIGFIKLQLYDRLMNTSYHVLELFEFILKYHLKENIVITSDITKGMEFISEEVRDIFASEDELQERMDEEMLKLSFSSDEILN